MDSHRKLSSDRIYFLDNIRYLMVLLVVVLHSGSYVSPHWPVYKPMYNQNPWLLMNLLFFLDIFMMPVLFFIAGFFALPSFYGKSPLQFVKHKLKRLGIPWILGIVLYGPIHVYIWRYSHGVWPTTLRDCFLKK
ncbi:MAG: acyltransferase family protein [Desulfobacteraceae bacterium]|nr:acyltransferase family protein [Desulfobacteraceae bacterium]